MVVKRINTSPKMFTERIQVKKPGRGFIMALTRDPTGPDPTRLKLVTR